MKLIYVVEDHEVIRNGVVQYLTLSGYESEGFKCIADASAGFAHRVPDLLIQDVMLPDGDGFAFVKEIKAKSPRLPVLFLTARVDESDRILGFELGADDYIIKPFDSKELVARVKAVLRRFQPDKNGTDKPKGKIVEYPDLIVNQTNYSVIYRGKTIDMPPKELELLYFLAASPNQVFTREQLLDHIWGYEYMGDTRTVDVHIKRLREKIKDHEEWSISTVWGIGYKFEVKHP